MIDNSNLNLANRRSCKLRYKFKGPFKIIAKFKDTLFKLDLPGKINIHMIFYLSLFKPYIANNQELFPDQVQALPYPIIIKDQPEYKVKAIIDSRKHCNQCKNLIK